jgi:phosphoribosylformimino-5-aminoimidazole carboxamide ribotide isomerase
MLLIPAIDLKDGCCVRLRQGRMDETTHFSDDPVAMAEHWFTQGAQRLHIVDLNGAFAGKPVNGTAIAAIAQRYSHYTLQIGGGIRDEQTIAAYLDAGVDYCIIGTQAIIDLDFVRRACHQFPGHIIVGLDAKDGQIAINGWSQLMPYRAETLARRFIDDGAETIIYTDIGRDGMLTGPNIPATLELAQAAGRPIIASGGITNLDDVLALAAVAEHGLLGAITGRAIYEGRLDFAHACQALQTL